MNKIVVFCGNDIASSRNAFLEQITIFSRNGYEIIKKDGKDIDNEFLETISLPQGLFQQKRCLFIEKLFREQKKIQDNTFKKLLSLEIYVADWEDKEMTTKDQNLLKNLEIKNYNIPSSVFTFLDNLKPKNKELNLKLLKKAEKEKEAEFIFYMLIRHIRNLILTSEGETSNLPTWQIAKLKKQLTFFDQKTLFELYHKLLITDFHNKKSLLPKNLEYSLDLIISDI